MSIDLRYVERVRHLLIAAGTMGITFQDLNQKVRTPNPPSSDLRTLLEAWRKRRWVDNFTRPTTGHPIQIWRATQLMLDQWPQVAQALEALVYSPGLPLAQDASASRTSHPEASDQPVEAASSYHPRSDG